MVDLASGRREDVPLGAELLEPLALRVTGLLIGRVVVERVPGVGHLALAAGARDQTDPRRRDAALGLRLRVGVERRPEAEAGARAIAHVRLVRLEQVERAPVGVDEYLAERPIPHVD